MAGTWRDSVPLGRHDCCRFGGRRHAELDACYILTGITKNRPSDACQDNELGNLTRARYDASLYQEESQRISGNGADFHRQDLYDAIEAGHYPEWELAVQVIDEEDALAFGFDLLDPTKMLPEESVPLQTLGIMKLDANPINYFAETEQAMFQPGHIVRGIDFTDDSLLQVRIFSYLDTQINCHGGPNFEQLPINRHISRVHSNNLDGAGQGLIFKNAAPYSPNTINNGYPQQADQKTGRGFFSAPIRGVRGHLSRTRSETFSDHWSQPRLFYNSLSKTEQQMMIDVLRFELSVLAPAIQKNAFGQLNKMSHDIAARVGRAIDLDAPPADNGYYHDDKTVHMSSYGVELPTISAMCVGILVSSSSASSMAQGESIKDASKDSKVFVSTVGERTVPGVDKALSVVDATVFDAVIIADGTSALFDKKTRSTFYPPGRPAQIVTDRFHWGEPIGFLGNGKDAMNGTGVKAGLGI